MSKESLLVAIGITADGYRKILGVQLGDRESASSWREFFKDLKKRGLKGENLVLGIMDGLPGLEQAFTEAFPKARVQRCVVHKLRNVAAKLPRKIQKDYLDQAKRIFYADSLEKAGKRFQTWKAAWEKVAPSAVNCLEKDLAVVLSFYTQPKPYGNSCAPPTQSNGPSRNLNGAPARWTAYPTKTVACVASTPFPAGSTRPGRRKESTGLFRWVKEQLVHPGNSQKKER